MSIVLVSHGFQPDYEVGFANGLARNGVPVTLIASDRTLFERLEPSVKVLNYRGSQDRSRPAWKKAANLGLYVAKLVGLLLIRRPVVHLTGLLLSGASAHWAMECRLYRLLSSRLILTVHNVVPHGQDTPPMRAVLRKIYRVPHILVVHTAKAKQRLIDEFEVDAARIIVMEHGIDALVHVPQKTVDEVRSELKVPAQGRLALFFGAVIPYKGVDLLIQAVRDLGADTRIHIAGRCQDAAYKKTLESLIAAHPIAGAISWEDQYVSEARVSALLASADVLVMPYRHIDQSGVVFAAMRHGVPVVAFDVGSLRDYLPSGVGQVVPVGDLAALASAIERSPTVGSVRAGIFTTAEKYLWQRTVTPVIQSYAS